MTKVTEKHSTFFSKEAKSTAGVTIDSNLAQKYSSRVVNLAIQLKANNESSTFSESDQYYLDMAQKYLNGSALKSISTNYNMLSGNCAITDTKWAGYSYEEILQMEADGYNIPQEVVQWAHSQQESDVTAYVILSDETQYEDENSKTDNSVENLQKKAKQYIAQSQQAIKESKEEFEEYKVQVEQAKKQKEEKENNYKDKNEEIEKLTGEWKALDDKKQAGGLSRSEKRRYSEIGKKINGSNGTLMKELQTAHEELDNYLDSLEGLDAKTKENSQLSLDTEKAGRDLSKIDSSYTETKTVHSADEINTNNGLLDNVAQNLKGDELALNAIDTARELEDYNNEIITEISSEESVALKDFATDYTELAEKTESNTKETMGDDYDNEAENQNEDKVKGSKYSVAKVFSAENSVIATGITLASIVDLNQQKQKTEDQESDLKKEVKKSKTETKNLGKEIKNSEQKHSINLDKEEEFLAKLEESQSTPEGVDDSQSIIAEINVLDNEDDKLQTDNEKAIDKSTKSTEKSQKLAKLLRGENVTLGKINDNTKQVATDTIVVGVGTAVKSIITTFAGQSLISAGIIKTTFPPTEPLGLAMIKAGIDLIMLGNLELATGSVAATTGAAGLVVSSTATDTETSAETASKDALATVKENKAEIKDASQVTNEQSAETSGDAQAQQTQDNTTTATTTTTSSTSTEEKTETTEKGAEATTDSTSSETKKEETDYDVSKGFDFVHATKAMVTTAKATADVNTSQDEARENEKTLVAYQKKVSTLNRNSERNQTLLEQIQKKTAQKAEQVTQKIETANTETQQAAENGNDEQVVSAQIEANNLTAELNESVSTESRQASQFTRGLTQISSDMNNYQKQASSLKTDLSKFNNTISQQLDVSQDTLVVGGGTIAVGAVKKATGAGIFMTGAVMAAVPITHAAGVAMEVAGEALFQVGNLDVVTGTGAMAAGTAGLAVFNNAKSARADMDGTVSSSTSQINSTRKTLTQRLKVANQITKETQNTTNEIAAISASASSNVSVGDNVETDDKSDKKLTRFNNDSIIESKKKKKKVVAVSASSKG